MAGVFRGTGEANASEENSDGRESAIGSSIPKEDEEMDGDQASEAKVRLHSYRCFWHI
jgi:hypothetical protein